MISKDYAFRVKVSIINASSPAVALEMARGVMSKAAQCALVRTDRGLGSIKSASLIRSREIKKKVKESREICLKKLQLKHGKPWKCNCLLCRRERKAKKVYCARCGQKAHKGKCGRPIEVR